MSTKYPYVASGFKEDCIKLLTTFGKADNIRFETFCKVWQNMKFSLVFTCRESFADLLEFCEEALHIVKHFFLPPFGFKERIGGLYLLYGLYYKMPLEKFVKIRVTLSDWNNILELCNQIREGEHLDANYILSKMILDCAFVHCLFERELGLDKHFKVNKFVKPINNYSIIPSIKNLTKPNELLSKMNDLSKLYEAEKSTKFKSIPSGKSLQLFDSNFAENIIKEVDKIIQCRLTSSQSRDVNWEKDPELKMKKFKKSVNKTRPILGHGFDTDSSDEDNPISTYTEPCNDLPDILKDHKEDAEDEDMT